MLKSGNMDVNKYKKAIEEIADTVTVDNIVLFDNSSDRLEVNYTLNCFFDKTDLVKVTQMLGKLRVVDDRQAIYSPELLHVTLLGQMDINCDRGRIIKTAEKFFKENEIRFHLFGVGTSKKVSSVTAYPEGFEIAQLRK
jgi:hypothetical protein